MKAPVAIVGLGQLGVVLSQGVLRGGRPVIPVLRGQLLSECLGEVTPECVIVATGEDDLGSVLDDISERFIHDVVLLQNELRPDQWLRHGITAPSVAIIWFEKRPNALPTPVLPSVLFGKHAPLLAETFDALRLPHRTITTSRELAHELVLKNLYILGLNLCGLRHPGRARALLGEHRGSFDAVISELLSLEAALLEQAGPPFSGISLDRERLKKDLEGAVLADLDHGTSGRSAKRRLERILAHAATLGLSLPTVSSLRHDVTELVP